MGRESQSLMGPGCCAGALWGAERGQFWGEPVAQAHVHLGSGPRRAAARLAGAAPRLPLPAAHHQPPRRRAGALPLGPVCSVTGVSASGNIFYHMGTQCVIFGMHGTVKPCNAVTCGRLVLDTVASVMTKLGQSTFPCNDVMNPGDADFHRWGAVHGGVAAAGGAPSYRHGA